MASEPTTHTARSSAPQGAHQPPTGLGRVSGLLGAHKVLIGVLVGVGLVLGVSFPFAGRYDDSMDVQRLGYNDASAVARLQRSLIEDGGAPKPFDIGPGGDVTIAGERFTPRPGNRVVTIVSGAQFCVQVTHEDPEVRTWTYDSAEVDAEYDDVPGGACGS